MPGRSEETSFGFRRVPLEHKQARVDDVFHSVANRYDLMNDLMSGGLHRAWKDVLVTAVNPPKQDRPFDLLDLAGGTGDIAFRVVEAGGLATRATVLDVNAAMLEVGQARAEKRGLAEQVSFIEANAEALRVLRLGGRFLCLEFSAVDVPGFDTIYDFYSFNVIPALGRVVAGDADAYRYLVESIRRFPRPDAFAEMMRGAGLRRVSFQRLAGGIVALHSGWRL